MTPGLHILLYHKIFENIRHSYPTVVSQHKLSLIHKLVK